MSYMEQQEEVKKLCDKYLVQTREVKDERLHEFAKHLISWFRYHTYRYVRKEILLEEYMTIINKLGIWTGRISWSDTDTQIRHINLAIWSDTDQDYL